MQQIETERAEATSYTRTAAEARRLGVSVRTLFYWVEQRKIPCRKIGHVYLFSPAEVDSALQKFSLGPTSPRKRRAIRSS